VMQLKNAAVNCRSALAREKSHSQTASQSG
jgi:hypothetical protein